MRAALIGVALVSSSTKALCIDENIVTALAKRWNEGSKSEDLNIVLRDSYWKVVNHIGKRSLVEGRKALEAEGAKLTSPMDDSTAATCTLFPIVRGKVDHQVQEFVTTLREKKDDQNSVAVECEIVSSVNFGNTNLSESVRALGLSDKFIACRALLSDDFKRVLGKRMVTKVETRYKELYVLGSAFTPYGFAVEVTVREIRSGKEETVEYVALSTLDPCTYEGKVVYPKERHVLVVDSVFDAGVKVRDGLGSRTLWRIKPE